MEGPRVLGWTECFWASRVEPEFSSPTHCCSQGTWSQPWHRQGEKLRLQAWAAWARYLSFLNLEAPMWAGSNNNVTCAASGLVKSPLFYLILTAVGR